MSPTTATPTAADARIAELEADLEAKQKTIDALIDAAERRQEALAPNGYEAWREAAALEQRVTRRTLHLSRALAVLQQRTARYRTQVEDYAVLRAVLDAVPAAIYWTGAQGTCLGGNRTFATLVGVADAEQVIGRRPEELLPAAAAVLTELHTSVLATGARAQPVEIAVDEDGSAVPYFLSMVPLREEDSVVGSLGALADIREVRALERQLAQSQRLESIGALAAGIAHEINTPLQYISGHLSFLDKAGERFRIAAERLETIRAGLPPEDAAAEEAVLREEKIGFALDNYPTAVAEARDGVETVSRIVRAMKEFAHPGGEGKVLTDLNSAVNSTLVVTRNAYKYIAEAVTELDPELPLVPALEGEIKQVFVNLIVNASDAIAERQAAGSPERGTLTISTAVSAEGDAVEVRFTDDGTGIPDHIQAHIFDPFFTTKEVGKGSGQGLALAHQCVAVRHAGRIAVESEPGVGTTFVLTLPLEAST